MNGGKEGREREGGRGGGGGGRAREVQNVIRKAMDTHAIV